jgi:hypothetical protein
MHRDGVGAGNDDADQHEYRSNPEGNFRAIERRRFGGTLSAAQLVKVCYAHVQPPIAHTSGKFGCLANTHAYSRILPESPVPSKAFSLKFQRFRHDSKGGLSFPLDRLPST